MIFRLEATKRTVGKKSLNTELRKSGLIPAVIYGQGETGIPISLNKMEFMKEYKKSIGEIAFFNINIEGKEYNTIMKERQIHPVRRDVIHVDFLELHKDTPINVNVPLKFIGQPEDLKNGGILEIGMRHLSLTCLPAEIPEDFQVDISNLRIGQSIHVKDIDIKNLHIHDAADLTIASIHTARGLEIEAEAAEAAPAPETETEK
ncbi:MAG TPA: 50S ribosomal protein L25 [Candidatus Cloacimonadota bacterium]|nr:50S ribosomal protein L25 [Candidatus Cloacimonadota bacterium]HPT71785.1 50S ribosomal protein L25 [Candidatus Cloacimonadota bacterium]